MSPNDDFDDEEKGGFFKRFRGPLIAGAVVAALAGFVATQLSSGHGPSSRKQESFTSVSLPPLPPPPPPPPPPTEQKVEEKMIDQTPVAANEEKPDDKPPDSPPDLSTNVQGTGGPDFGLRSGGGTGTGRHMGSGSQYGWYAAQVQMRIADALRRNNQTKYAGLNLKVRIWSDATGRVERAKLAGTTGDPNLDNAIRNEVLTGLQLQEPPPRGMPMPIVLRLSARKAN